MQACAQPRSGQSGTWISADIRAAYGALHREGWAHSIEVWHAGELIAGLYGVALGRMFFGESMFTLVRDCSKVALATLIQIMRIEHVSLIDCQQSTAHLASLGAREITRAAFRAHLDAVVPQAPIDWTQYRQRSLKSLLTTFG
jgi:leucyl/phenylalanyl-tRNA---protein transferase